MQSYITQVYEIQTLEEAQKCVDLGVDHIGSVILTAEQWQQEAIKSLVDFVKKSGRKSTLIPLFDDEIVIRKMVDFYQRDIFHFCSTPFDLESPDLYKQIDLQAKLVDQIPQTEMMRSIPVAEQGKGHLIDSSAIASLFEDISDYLMSDTVIIEDNRTAFGDALTGSAIGITGKLCDWHVVADLVEECICPFIMAGGLSAQNVYDGLIQTKPYGVDTCTQTNARDASGKPIRFKKDFSQLEKFISEVRRAHGAKTE